MTEPADDTSNNTNIVPHTTTPTWEMELLVSGGTVFGLMQLAGFTDDAFISLTARASEAMNQGISPLWIYIKFVLLTLIGTFITHLCLRGYWVALVGMNSVYPGGIDWEKLRQGPISRSYSETHVPPLPALIEKADNLATRVFGVGFGLAMMMLLPILVVSVSILCSFMARKFFDFNNTPWIFIGIFLVLFLPIAVAAIIDRRFGKRLVPGGWPHRLMMATFGFYDRVGMGRTNNILLTLFISKTGVGKWMGLAFLIMGAVFTLVLVQIATMRGGLEFGDYPGLPDKELFDKSSTPSSFYASQRSTEPTITPLPHIADRIVRGPYLELFVPYRPRMHTPMLEKHCPQALAASTDKNPRPALDCLAKLHAVQIDGKSINLTFDASDDRNTGQRGMLAMIPVGALSPGRHELSVLEVNPNRDLPETPTPVEEAAVTNSPANAKDGSANASLVDAIAPPTVNEPKKSAATAKADPKDTDMDPPRRYRIPFWK